MSCLWGLVNKGINLIANKDFITIFIAILAFLSTIYNSFLHRRHFKLSLRPVITSETQQEYDDLNNLVCKVLIRNAGSGPAFINSFEIYYDNQKYIFTDIAPFFELVEKVFGELLLDDPKNTLQVYRKEGIIPAGDVITLVNIRFKLSTPQDYSNFYEIFGKFKIVFRYRSIYNDSYIYDSSTHFL